MRSWHTGGAADLIGLSLPGLCPAFQPAGGRPEHVFDTPFRDGIGERYSGREIDRSLGHRGGAAASSSR
jgi:hypothetical protein